MSENKRWLLFLSIALEINAIASVLFGHSMPFCLLFFLFHSISAFLLALFTFLLLPNRFKQKTNLAVISIFIFLLPMIGYIVIPVTYIVMLRKQKYLGLFSGWESLLPEETLMEKVSVKKREFGEGAIGNLISAKGPRQVKLILLAKDFLHPITFSLIKKVVSENNEEARLYAFSLLSTTENRINDQIEKLLRAFKSNPPQRQKAYILSRIAQLYWELIYLRIPDKELEEFYLDKALKYILDALSIEENAEFFFVAGRIYLKRGDIKQAKDHFQRAFNTSKPNLRIKVIPYLAEVYFKEGNLDLVKELFKQLNFSIYPQVGFMKEFWLKDGFDR